MTNPFVPILVMMAVAAALTFGGIGASAIIGPKRYNRVKVANYECGIDPTPRAGRQARFQVRYYLIAMTFIIFDIEVVFMYPWAVRFRELGWPGFIVMMVFVVVLAVGFIYELKKGALRWD